MAFANLYLHRKVAEARARSCEICYKPSPSVLITADNKDFFYVCTSHLKDANFCTPKIDQAVLDARKKKELDEEVARVKKEYEEKQRKKKEKGDEDEKEKKKKKKKKDGKDKDDEEEVEKQKKKDSKDKDDEKKDPDGHAKEKEKETDKDGNKPESEEDEPRVFVLNPSFYQQRLSKKRQMELAKRNRERMQDPNFFPSVPQNQP